jgi:hypothetical protein
MSAPKRPPLPVILLANDLLDGVVVFWTADGWSPDPAKALVAHDGTQADVLEAIGQQAFARNEVVDPALIDVTLDASGKAIPNHFRERFKISGPSVRRDLGKQADYLRT